MHYLDSLIDSVEDAPAEGSARYGRLVVPSKCRDITEFQLRGECHEACAAAFACGLVPVVFVFEDSENGEMVFDDPDGNFPEDCTSAAQASTHVLSTTRPIEAKYSELIHLARTLK